MAVGDIKQGYGANSNQTITITLASLGNGAYRQSTYINNAVDKFLDALVSLVITPAAAGVGATGNIVVYAYASCNAGNATPDYHDNVTGADGAVTPYSPTGLVPIGQFPCNANSGVQATFKSVPFSVARAFGGVLPERWGIVVLNNSGAALAAAGQVVSYQGVYGSATLS